MGIILLGDKSVPELDTIYVNSHGNVIKCCAAMFTLWLERQPEASWRQLIDALINVELVSLAAEIKRLLIPSDPKNSQQISTDLQGTCMYVVSQ